jgi:hypothetical protein
MVGVIFVKMSPAFYWTELIKKVNREKKKFFIQNFSKFLLSIFEIFIF